MERTLLGVVALGCAALAGCSQAPTAQACDAGTFKGAFAGEVVVAQNWNCLERQEFWFTDQGSQILPYVWFIHLEQAGSTEKFGDPANIDRYRYLPQSPTALNPDGLPIGFTKGTARADRANGEISRDWLGMTCAACHTGQVEYQGAKYLIDGAPTMGDFQGLFRGLVKAMKATLGDEAKFGRFAAAVIADSRARNNGGTGDSDQLRTQLDRMTTIRDDWNKRNQGTAESGDYGHGRLDAVGAIINEVVAIGLGEPGNVTPADAPVSYPFIWDTPQHDKVQWNGSITNAGLGALTRNVAEVLGVFGALDVDTDSGNVRATSVNIAGLARLEGLLSQLQSPRWRDTSLPAVEPAKVVNGREVFEDFCAGCHRDIDRADPDRRIKARMFPVFNPKNPADPNALATDITMARNFLVKNFAAPGMIGNALTGAILLAFLEDTEDALKALKAGQPADVVVFVDEAAARHLAGTVDPAGIGAFLGEINAKYGAPKTDPNKPVCFPRGILPCYKARPLNGIWATAPYLHNGSVRTMRQLLLPAAQREPSFQVGTREFDPVDMGFRNEGAFTLDTSLPGNSNAGHDGPIYGNEELANDKDRMDALLEYLKTL